MELLNAQYDALMGRYTEQQNRNYREQERRYQEVLAAAPELKELDDSVSTLSTQATIRALDGDEQALAALKGEIADIAAKKEALLTSHGFAKDYLDPIYECNDCQDTGYINNEKCHCFKKAIVDYLYSQSNIQDILEQENFNFFDISLYPDDYIEESTSATPRDNMNTILKAAKEFVTTFDEVHANLLLYGATGVGKTFLSHCIAKELLNTSHTVVYLTSLELFDILEKYKFDRHQNAKEKSATLAYVLECDLLIIDDLGTELTNAFTSSQLYQCIDSRLNRNHSTIISTNLSFDDLRNQYSERIFSRITSQYKLLKITGDDIRLKKALTR